MKWLPTAACAALLAVLAVLPAETALSASASGARVPHGAPVTPRSVVFSQLPRATPGKGGVTIIRREGVGPQEEEIEEAKREGRGPQMSEMRQLTLDPTASSPFQPLAPTAGTAFEGITQHGFIPSEPSPAAGPNQIFTTGNVTVTITDKDGTNRTEVDGATFFGAPGSEGAISDPVCFYDALRGRFLALCFTQGTAPNFSYFYLAISKTSDARGAWWLYKFDQTLDNATPTANWSDYEELGVSDDKLAMSSQQFTFAGNMFAYQKIRVLDRALAYSGGPVSFVDIVNFTWPAGGNSGDVFVTKVARNLSAGDNTIHCFNVRTGSGTHITYRTVTGPPSAPVISAGNFVTVASYSAPPDAKQLGSATLVATNDCRPGAIIVRNGVLIATWHTALVISSTTVSAVRLFRMQTSDRTVLTDEAFAAANTFYYYPAVTVDSVGTLFLGFGRSSSTEFPSSYATGKRRGDASLQASVLLKAGLSATAQSRWGDYTNMDMDATASGPSGSTAWYAGQFTKTTNNFGTWISKLTFTYGVIAGGVFDDCDGSAATTGDRTPLAGVTLTLKQGATTLGTTTSDVSGNYSFGYLESGTYDVFVTPPGGSTATDAVPGTGGTSQTKVSALDLQINLTNAQNSTGNVFLEGSTHVAPVATSIVPVVKNMGDPTFPLTVNGSSFLPCAVVRLDGSPRATAFVNSGQLTATIPASDLVSAGLHQITVFNPAPGGGASNPETLTVQFFDGTPPTVTLGAPNGGEAWKAGTSHYITWGASDNTGVTGLDLSYSTDGGLTFPNTIATGVPNTGPYLWTVPNTPSTTARVRIVAHDGSGNTAADTSDANFTISQWIIVATAGAGGSISPSGAVGVPNGGSQVFTITPDAFHHITDVQVDSASIGVTTSHTFTNVTAGHTLEAAFATDTHTLSVTTSGSGSVAKLPDQASYLHGTLVQLTATPASGWSFVAWSGDTATSANPLGLPMTGNRSVTATFADSSAPVVQVLAPNGGETFVLGSATDLTWSASDNIAVTAVDLLLSRTGSAGSLESVALGIANTGTYNWTVTGPATANAFLRVVAHDANGNTAADTSDAAFTIISTLAAGDAPVTEFELAGMAPNPVRAHGRVSFAIPRSARVRLSIVDVQGREVAVLADGEWGPGRYERVWDGHAMQGPARAGLYFVRLTTPSHVLVRRFALLR
jgi:Divergent InlB B-repeat domain/SdrD B-like domain